MSIKHSLHLRLQLWYGAIIASIISILIIYSIVIIRNHALESHDEAMYKIAFNLTKSYKKERIYNKRQNRKIKKLNRKQKKQGLFTETPGKSPENLPPVNSSVIEPLPVYERLRINNIKKADEGEFYFVVYKADGEIILRSDTPAPENFPLLLKPVSNIEYRYRNRQRYRELIRLHPDGFHVAVGISKEQLYANSTKLIIYTLFIGVTALALGLFGGNIIVRKSLSPLVNINDTVKKIAEGDLTKRLDDNSAPKELSPLITELNSAFSFLEKAFTQHKNMTENASHELRSPIAALMAEVESILRRERSAPEYQVSLETCKKVILRLKHLVDQLGILSRLDSTAPSTPLKLISPNEIISDAIVAIEPLANRKSISISFFEQNCFTKGDPELFYQAISGIIANGIFYNKPGGTLHIDMAVKASVITLSIQDNGPGIDSRHLPFIFERHYRANQSNNYLHHEDHVKKEGHSGLGLAIAKEVFTQMKGNITVRSQLNIGTTFVINIPRCNERKNDQAAK